MDWKSGQRETERVANLLIEIGNTALKAAYSDGITLGKTFRYQGEKVMDFIMDLLSKEKPYVTVIASVYGISSSDAEMLRSATRELLILDRDHPEELQRNSLPSCLTYDRAASIVAARYLFRGRGCTIVDFGTTLTVDMTDSEGRYMEGIISPGCRTRFKALNRYSRELSLLDSPEIKEFSPLSTEGSMVKGVISGMVFEIEGYLGAHPDHMAVFTGGDANYFAKRMKNSIFVISNLVLMGLALIADRYVTEMEK